MGVACVALRISLRRGRYVGNIQWDSMRKGPTAWVNLYGAGVLVLGDTINYRDGEKLKETVCPTRGPWFGNFMRGSKLWMGVINKQDFGVSSEMVKDLLEVWEVECGREGLIRRRMIYPLDAAVVVGFCGGLWGE